MVSRKRNTWSLMCGFLIFGMLAFSLIAIAVPAVSAEAELSAERNILLDQPVKPGENFTVIVNISSHQDEMYAPSLNEDLPDGWTVNPLDDNGAEFNGTSLFKASTNEWVWVENFFTGSQKTVSYEVNVPSSMAHGTYEIGGNVSVVNDSRQRLSVGVAGENTVTVGSGIEPSIKIEPEYVYLSKGSRVVLNISIDPAFLEVYGIQYDLNFNPANLQVIEQTQGSFLSQDGASTTPIGLNIDNNNGIVSYGESRLESAYGVSGAGVISSIEFEVKDPVSSYGDNLLEFSNVLVSDNKSQSLSFAIYDGIINVSENRPPVADAGGDILRGENAGIKVSFNGSASYDPDGEIALYTWAFEDETTEDGVEVSHSYAEAGNYNVTLNVKDDYGAEDQDTIKVVVWRSGDSNGDGAVNIFDAVIIGTHWNENKASPDFSGDADLNNDGSINIFDIVLVGLNWD